MKYTLNKKVNKPFEQAVRDVTEELKKEGFGIITEIDLKEKFKEKLNVDFSQYKILGACNPALAYKAVQVEPSIGVMLPCNVLVRETTDGEVEVNFINPLYSIGAIEQENLSWLAQEVHEKLSAVRDRI
jgi:uncharacterized protein (DUF302 family)